MKVYIYTIYDKVSEECGPLFQAKNDFVANRLVDSLARENPNIPLDEYELYCLGEFDTESRSFVPEKEYGRLALTYAKPVKEVNE